MPYLRYLFCEQCGFPANLDVNYMETINQYISDGRKTTTIDDREIVWDYLIYSCAVCRRSYRYTFMDVERLVRKYLCSEAGRQKDRIDDVAENQITHEDRLEGTYFVERSKEVSKRLRDMYSK